MSSGDYLRNKLASLPKVTSIRKPTDSSVHTRRVRMAGSGNGFFVDGPSVGSLRNNTDTTPLYVNNPHASVSSIKATAGRVPSASDYTTYAGSRAAALDILNQNTRGNELKSLMTVQPPPAPRASQYRTSSDVTRILKSDCRTNTGGVTDGPGAPLFVDNTIRLSSGVPSKVDGCCGTGIGKANIEDANHTHSPGLLTNNPFSQQNMPYKKPGYEVPNPQPPNVAPKQGGGYLGPRSVYVENKHGFVQPTAPIPKAPGGQGQDKATLRINDPTFFNKV